MVFNATFNNVFVISWRSVLFVEETGVPRANQIYIVNILFSSYLVIQVFIVGTFVAKPARCQNESLGYINTPPRVAL